MQRNEMPGMMTDKMLVLMVIGLVIYFVVWLARLIWRQIAWITPWQRKAAKRRQEALNDLLTCSRIELVIARAALESIIGYARRIAHFLLRALPEVQNLAEVEVVAALKALWRPSCSGRVNRDFERALASIEKGLRWPSRVVDDLRKPQIWLSTW